MVEVIQLHSYKEGYPFNLEKQTQFTYVELIKQITSETELHTYRQNLALFKSLQSELIIRLDSYARQNNNLQLYYQYQPISIKSYIEQKLPLISEEYSRESFLTKIITTINLSIEEIITLLINRKIMALLSIQNMAVTPSHQIKFFIEPDFQYLQRPSLNQLNDYYNTQKKKLQIQLEQFLEHIFSSTNQKPKEQSKANFVIQGTKLVFVNNQQTHRQSGISTLNVLPQKRQDIKLPTYMLKDSQPQHNINNSSKQKFDIKNILDQKKLQKNQSQLHAAVNTKSIDSGGEPLISQKIHLKKSLANTTSQKKLDKDGKQVRNYFDNNDDFNKDASFYPQEFIKEDSIAEFDGYEDELEKELEDLKKKKYQDERITDLQKNRLSMVPNKTDNSQLTDQKMNNIPTTLQNIPSTKTPVHTVSHKYPASHQIPQNFLNSSNSQDNDTSTEQKKKKKYKVTITTSHEVDVDDDEGVDLRNIEQQLIEDIKKGTLRSTADGNKHNNSSNNIEKQYWPTLNNRSDSEKEGPFPSNLPLHLLKGHTRETHNPSSSHQIHPTNFTHQKCNYTKMPTSLNSIVANRIEQHQVDERPFSKQHPHIVSETGQYVYTSNKQLKDMAYNLGILTQPGSSIGNARQTHDINKIIEKIKNSSQNQNQNHSNSSINQNTQYQQHQNEQKEQQKNGYPEKKAYVSKQLQKRGISDQSSSQQQHRKLQHQGQEETRPHSQLSTYVNSSKETQNQQKRQLQYDKEYYDKIQKAKMKAEQIMKLVKERKAQ